ncbi:MAG: hypothetical protein HYU84_09335 [Chloroflexi bacterium]|nr:hypothetical protein [Chloroflexota bacterium]MBI3167842.1 hypothetical protein [Chloroflexota bacterium]
MQKYLPVSSILLIVATLFSIWFYPEISSILGIISLLASLALSVYAIFHKHKGTENARPKILKEVGVMVLTLVIILFLGGIVAMLANYQVGIRWGEVAGLVSAIGSSFLVGYLVRKGMMKFSPSLSL